MRSRHDRLLDIAERRLGLGVDLGVIRQAIEDERLSDATVTMGGRTMVNFSTCSYLGLNRDKRLKEGAIEAVERYGPNYSSAPIYSALPTHHELEARLGEMMEAAVTLVQTTTLAHISALPILIGPDDLALVDAQTHESVHLATTNLKGNGVTVASVPHADIDVLAHRLSVSASEYHRVWFLSDGVFSMYGDVAPVAEVAALQERYPNLHTYYDDAHGLGWAGENGRGYVLSQIPWNDRMVIAAGMAKSFGAFGAVLAFGNPKLVRRVQLTGGALTFSGPIPPADLGAGLASAAIHLSPEHGERQQALLAEIDWVRGELVRRRLPVVSLASTPIWFVRVGSDEATGEMIQRLMADGFYLNASSYPAVPLGKAGVRFTQTLHHSREQITAMLDAMAAHMPELSEEPHVVIDLREEGEVSIDVEGHTARTHGPVIAKPARRS